MLTDTKQVIEALGGRNAVQELTGRGYKTVWHWADADRFPKGMYLRMVRALELRGLQAPAKLWGQDDESPATE